MDNITIYETAWGDFDASIELRKSEEMLRTAKRVSDYLSGLPLTVEQNDRLVALMLEHMQATHRSGFAEGVRFMLELDEEKEELT